MPRPRTLPPPDYLEFYAERVLKLIRRTPPANPIQHMVRFNGMYWGVIESAVEFPYDMSPYLAGCLNEVLCLVEQEGRSVPDAVAIVLARARGD